MGGKFSGELKNGIILNGFPRHISKAHQDVSHLALGEGKMSPT